jgi:hypothetical protein
MQEIGTRLRVTDLAQLGDAMLAVYDEARAPDPVELLTQRLIDHEVRLRQLESRTWGAWWSRCWAWIRRIW